MSIHTLPVYFGVHLRKEAFPFTKFEYIGNEAWQLKFQKFCKFFKYTRVIQTALLQKPSLKSKKKNPDLILQEEGETMSLNTFYRSLKMRGICVTPNLFACICFFFLVFGGSGYLVPRMTRHYLPTFAHCFLLGGFCYDRWQCHLIFLI